jgi:hypothetical protein
MTSKQGFDQSLILGRASSALREWEAQKLRISWSWMPWSADLLATGEFPDQNGFILLKIQVNHAISLISIGMPGAHFPIQRSSCIQVHPLKSERQSYLLGLFPCFWFGSSCITVSRPNRDGQQKNSFVTLGCQIIPSELACNILGSHK